VRLPGVEPGLAASLDKCLCVERAGRYAGPAPLAEDLALHAAGCPCATRPTRAADRLRKWARRNRQLVSDRRWPFGATLVALGCLVAAAVHSAGGDAGNAGLGRPPRRRGTEVGRRTRGRPPRRAGFDEALRSARAWLDRYPPAGGSADTKGRLDPARLASVVATSSS
jgi:hypothetical protein